jgi:hypothetical protein
MSGVEKKNINRNEKVSNAINHGHNRSRDADEKNGKEASI